MACKAFNFIFVSFGFFFTSSAAAEARSNLTVNIDVGIVKNEIDPQENMISIGGVASQTQLSYQNHLSEGRQFGFSVSLNEMKQSLPGGSFVSSGSVGNPTVVYRHKVTSERLQILELLSDLTLPLGTRASFSKNSELERRGQHGVSSLSAHRELERFLPNHFSVAPGIHAASELFGLQVGSVLRLPVSNNNFRSTFNAYFAIPFEASEGRATVFHARNLYGQNTLSPRTGAEIRFQTIIFSLKLALKYGFTLRTTENDLGHVAGVEVSVNI